MPNWGLYYRTLRHLRVRQLIGQVRVRLQRALRAPAKILTKPGRDLQWPDGQRRGYDLPPVPDQKAEALASGRFCFIGQTAILGKQPDWNTPNMPKLWEYNLHYFDWLWSLLPTQDESWEDARRLTIDWIDNHTPTKGACGWEPYPVSLRLINWTLLFCVRHWGKTSNDPEFCDKLTDSVNRQVKWLEMNLETHIQANHLLENLAALACVSSVWSGAGADKLRKKVLPLLSREINEQVLADGLHYERSPMYHLRMLWLVELLDCVGDDEVRSEVSGTATKMRSALGCLRHPDGGIALFNDAALGVYSDPWLVNDVAHYGSWSLPEAGYYGSRFDDDCIIIDAGAIGPDHQPGHAHADLFSYELSLQGQRVITDTGVSSYVTGPARSYDRSTAAHSTVEIESEDSVEVWGGFRVGRRNQPEVLVWDKRPDGFFLKAKHDGYKHLSCSAVHYREFEWNKSGVSVSDRIEVTQTVRAVSRIHLAPSVGARVVGDRVECQKNGITFFIEVKGGESITITEKDSYLHFGKPERRAVIEVSLLVEAPYTDYSYQIGYSVDESNDRV